MRCKSCTNNKPIDACSKRHCTSQPKTPVDNIPNTTLTRMSTSLMIKEIKQLEILTSKHFQTNSLSSQIQNILHRVNIRPIFKHQEELVFTPFLPTFYKMFKYQKLIRLHQQSVKPSQSGGIATFQSLETPLCPSLQILSSACHHNKFPSYSRGSEDCGV